MSLIERWSNNVINIEYLKKFLNDDTLNNDNIKKSSDAIKIINQFLRQILGTNVSYNNKRSYQILEGKTPKPGSYRGRVNNEPENNRKTLLDLKNA